ncbi:helix-turn-helix domain-containing protein [Amnibacterium setariae]|uniref:XRE family transcriptional regulator n=1 Tax=Amnibacterium setariae TaxID=2306585 RepID=A0A3A1TVT4_9MICO|nr:helix-turn-helix transcriptional regulator [Amnibacterium setariae]RIX28373.1 XRE family transcriptional regulator [Amnibacterium setariae]
MTDDDDIARNREAQARLYGLPVGDLLRRYSDALGVTQGRLADLLGVSAPMLSQLANGRRVRFGNPVSVQRLQALHAAVLEVEAGRLAREGAIERVEANRAADVFTATAPAEPDPVEAVQRLFALAGAPEEHRAAAALLDPAHPGIARLLRAAGAGGAEDLRALLAAARAAD